VFVRGMSIGRLRQANGWHLSRMIVPLRKTLSDEGEQE
jgi:hypothetical protein